MTTAPTGKGDDRNRDKSLHGLLVALGITSIIAVVVIVFAYAASDGAVFGITESLTSLQNEPVVADLTSSTTSIQDQAQEVVTVEQQQEIDQKEEEPVASQVDLVVVEKQTDTNAKTVKVPVRSAESLQYVDMPAHENDSTNNINTSTSSTPDNTGQVREKNNLNDNNNSILPSSPSQPATSLNPSELTKEEKKALKEKLELEKKLSKEKETEEEKLQKSLSKAGDNLCSSVIDGIVNDNIEVSGACQIEATVKGKVKLDAPDDSVNFDSGSLDGNIESKDSGEVNVASGTSINGNVKSENTTDTSIGAATVRGNIEVKDGNLKILSGAEIFGNVKHEGSGICVVAAGAIIHGNIEGCPAS